MDPEIASLIEQYHPQNELGNLLEFDILEIPEALITSEAERDSALTPSPTTASHQRQSRGEPALLWKHGLCCKLFHEILLSFPNILIEDPSFPLNLTGANLQSLVFTVLYYPAPNQDWIFFINLYQRPF